MVNDNQNLFNIVLEIRENIYDECQKSAYFAPIEYQQCCERILNAEMILYDDTIGIMNSNASIGSKTSLSLDSLIELQKKVLNTLLETENIIDKEKRMHKLFVQQKISPENYFKLNAKISELLPTTARAN